MTLARGTFEVTLTPQSPDEASDAAIGRMLIDKRFSGDLDGESKGQMLSTGTAVEGSAGYVAIERVVATLHGRSGTFTLQHNGTMSRGVPGLTISVVPDSGTEDLSGLSGEMTIDIVEGKHHYEFTYELAAQ